MKRLAVCIFLVLLLVGCSQSEVKRNKDVESAIDSIVKDLKNSEINIHSVTDFEWDKAFLFTPYSTEEDMKEQLGVDFKDQSALDTRDDIYLLVFLYEDNVVQYAEINRQGASFTIGDKEYLTPSDDEISIESD